MGENILEVRNLTTSLNTERGRLTAVQGVSFHVEKGEILGLVGESGCGKSVTSQSIMRLYDEKRTAKYSGEILLDGENLLALPERDMRRIRGSRIAMVFQDSLSSLNPVFTCGEQIMESMRIHRGFTRAEARREAVDMLRLVGIPDPEKRFSQYPHELSGGMRQRVMIACALSCRPELLIADAHCGAQPQAQHGRHPHHARPRRRRRDLSARGRHVPRPDRGGGRRAQPL